jgi:TamB, inner membrane protein subunit of TAM complex
MSAPSKLRKRIGIAIAAILLLPFVVLGFALVALQFPPVRGFARDKLLEVVSTSLQGRLEVDDLRWPSLRHIELTGVRLWDRHGDRVGDIGLLSVHIDLAPLLAAKVHLTDVAVEQLFLDLGTPGTDHGLLSVFESKEPKPPEPETESKGSSIAIRIDRACLDGTAIKAKLQPDLAVALSRFDACAMFSMADQIEIRLDQLRGEVRYNDNPALQFIDDKLLHDWDAQPADAHVAGRELAKAFLKGKLTIAEPAMAFDGKLEVRGVSKRTLEAAQVDGDWLTGAADLSFAARGDISHMTFMFQLRAPDSQVNGEGEVSPETSATARISSEGLQLAKFTSIAIEPVKFGLQVDADLARKPAPAIKAQLSSGTYGTWALPVVTTEAKLGKAGEVSVPHFEARYPNAQVLGRAHVASDGAIEASLEANADLAKVPALKSNLPGWGGQLAMDAQFTRDAQGTLGVKSHTSLVKLKAEEPALAAEKLDLRVAVNGQEDRPVVHANLSVNELHFSDQRVAELQLTAAGGPDRYDIRAHADGDRANLNLWVNTADGLEAGGELDARLSRGVASATVQRVKLVSGQSLEIDQLKVTHVGASLVANGSLGLAGKKSELTVEARTDNLSALTQELGIDKLPGRLKMDALVTGALDKPSVDIDLDLRDGPKIAGSPLVLWLKAHVDAADARANVIARANAGRAALRAALNSRWRKGAPLDAVVDGHHALEVNLDNVQIAELLRQSETPPPMPLAGTIGANLKVSGTRTSIDLKSQVDAKVAIGKEPPLGVKVITEYGGGGLALNAEVADRHGNLVEANWHQATRVESFAEHPPELPDWLGHTDWEANIQLASRRVAELPSVQTQKLLRELWPLRTEASIELSHKAGSEPIGDVKLKTAWDPMYVDPARATCSQRVKPVIELNGKLRDGLFVSKVSGKSQDTQMLTIDAQLGSKLEEWLEGYPLEITKAKVNGKLENFDLAEWPVTCEQSAGALSASFLATDLFDKSAVFRAKFGGQGIVVGQSLPFDFAFEAQALPSGMDVMTRIDRIGGYALIKGSVPISVYVHDPATSVNMNGNLSADVALNRVDAKSLLQLVPVVARPSGTFDGHIKVYGTLGKPRGTGSIAMKDVSLTLPKLGQRFTKVNGSIGIADNRVQIPELELKDQGGTAKFRAELALETTDAFKVELNAKFDSFPVRKQGVLIGRADAKAKVQLASKPQQTDVQVHLSEVSVNLTGNTSADVQSLADHPEIVVAGEEHEVEEEEPDPNAPAPVINVKVRSDDSIWVKRDDFAVRMRVNLDVHVANGSSQITGEVRLERGYIALLGQQFDVKDGRVVFTGGQTVNPSLELTAQSTSPAGKVVTVQVTGFVSAPQLAFDVDGKAANAGEALIALTGHGDTGTQQSAEDQLASAAIGMTTGLLSLGARREFGDFIPMLSIDQSTQDTRVRAGFEADKLIPDFMRGFVRGAYVEGIVSTGDNTNSKGGENTSGNAQTGVLLELQLPSDLVWAGKYGPGQTWSVDLDWRP